jgi:hypothetical protein
LVAGDASGAARLAELYAVHRRLEELYHAPAPEAIEAILTDIARGEADFVESVLVQARSESRTNARGVLGGVREMLSALWCRPVFRYGLSLAAIVVLASGLGVWLFPRVNAVPVLEFTADAGVSFERGFVTSLARNGMKLQPGDTIRLDPTRGSAALSFAPEKTRINLAPGAELKLASALRGKRLDLLSGRVEATVARQRPFRPMIITTPQAQARVVGTRFSLTVTTNATRLEVAEGKVRFSRLGEGAAVKVIAGQYAVVDASSELAALPQTGGILREWWHGVTGQTIYSLRDDPRFPGRPDRREMAPGFELTVAETNHLGVRIRGYVHPPITGEYRFWLQAEGAHAMGPEAALPDSAAAQLLLSPSENSSERVLIAQTGGPGASQAPPPIPMVAGRRYYIEAQAIIPKGAFHLAVAWKPPGGSPQLLTGEFMSAARPIK